MPGLGSADDADGHVAGGSTTGRGGRIAILGLVLVLECAWLVAVAYLVWRLVAVV
ncbi:MAG: hypothetical protein ACXVQQ_01535 [Gaiellaceae bacterium]